MAVDHYENFPVAAILLPPALREPVAAIYWFARKADDFADEGDLPPDERRALLAEYQAELDAIKQQLAAAEQAKVDLEARLGALGEFNTALDAKITTLDEARTALRLLLFGQT